MDTDLVELEVNGEEVKNALGSLEAIDKALCSIEKRIEGKVTRHISL